MANPKVFVGIPTLGSSDDACYISVSMALTHYKGPSMLCPHGGKPIGHNRNMIVTKFLETDAEYLWFVDNDCIIPINALELLLESDKPLSGTKARPRVRYGILFLCREPQRRSQYPTRRPLPNARAPARRTHQGSHDRDGLLLDKTRTI